MFNLDPGKLLIIGVVGIILLGPDKLPQVARQLGGFWRSFGEFRQRMETEVRGSIPDLPSTSDIARLARSPSALLNHLSNMDEANQQNAEGDAATASREAEAGTSAGDDGAEVHTNGASPNGITTHENGTTAREADSNGATPALPTKPLPRPTLSPPPDVIVTGDPSLN